jgi:hypothetical protein
MWPTGCLPGYNQIWFSPARYSYHNIVIDGSLVLVTSFIFLVYSVTSNCIGDTISNEIMVVEVAVAYRDELLQRI